MSFKDAFLDFIRTGRRRLLREVEDGPIKEAPQLSERDVDFILAEHVSRKWAGVEYCGPGAAEANARRARRLGIEQTPDPGVISQRPKKRWRLSKRERLQLRLEQLRADVARLEKGGE